MVSSFNQGHRPQIVVPAVVTGVALGVRNGSCQIMLARGVTRRATRFTRKGFAFSRLGMEMAGETFFAKFFNGWMNFIRWVKCKKRCDARLCVFIGDGGNAKTGGHIRLRAKSKADTGNRARVCGLDAGDHALDVMTIIRFAARVTRSPAARGFYYAESGWIRPASHRAVCQVRVEGETFPAVTGYAAKRLNGMRSADLRQVCVAGETVFGFARQGWGKCDGGG